MLYSRNVQVVILKIWDRFHSHIRLWNTTHAGNAVLKVNALEIQIMVDFF